MAWKKLGVHEKAVPSKASPAVSADGNLWVVEVGDAPERRSVWRLTFGALVREFFGGCSYSGWAFMDPQHPDELYCHNVFWKIDVDTGTCVTQRTIWRATAPDMIEAPNPGGSAGHFRVFTAEDGQQYGWGTVDCTNMLYQRDGDLFKPVAGTICIVFGPFGAGMLYPVMRGCYERTKAPAYL